jgi:hypothetical protein
MTHHDQRHQGKTQSAVAAAIAAGMILAPGMASAAAPQPVNKIVVMVDASGSYRARQTEAVTRAVDLLARVAETKLRRWDAGADQIAVVSLDALPEVLWQGTLRDLKAVGAEQWKARFQGRTDYAHCTDVSAGLRVALRFLDGDPRYTTRYLFTFSDLLHEPPTQSLRACRKPVALPGDVPWEELKDVQIHALWVPPDQKLVWTRAAQEHGHGQFQLYTPSESDQVTITPPPRAELDPATRAERQQKTQDQVMRGLGTAGRYWINGMIGIGGLFGLLLVIALVVSRFRRRRRQPVRRPAPSFPQTP